MTEFEMLLACYRSGQISERQWQGHLKDRAFRAWVENQNPINCPSGCSGRDNPGQEGEGAAADQQGGGREATMAEAPKRIWAAPYEHDPEPDGAPGIIASSRERDGLTEYVRADLAKPCVKGLEWHSFPLIAPTATTKAHIESTPFGTIYLIQTQGDGAPWVVFHDEDHVVTCGSLQAAKAAAQADYERRILSALEGGGDG